MLTEEGTTRVSAPPAARTRAIGVDPWMVNYRLFMDGLRIGSPRRTWGPGQAKLQGAGDAGSGGDGVGFVLAHLEGRAAATGSNHVR
ncbi:MAG: hypothetical protein ACKOGM_05600, partial [Solirubrobacterales bacterium]